VTPATFDAAYRQWHGPIRAWLYNAVGDLDVAADLASEAFCRALENWAKFTPTHDQSVKAWLYTIAKNTLIDHNRRRASVARRVALHRYACAVDDWHVVNARLDIEAAWPSLTDHQRQALQLTAEGYGSMECCRALGLTDRGFRVLVWRGRRALERLTV
jgi:RNA polymerase sigma-70 factor (ECF subfamily)